MRDSITVVFLWILRNFKEQLYYRTPLVAALKVANINHILFYRIPVLKYGTIKFKVKVKVRKNPSRLCQVHLTFVTFILTHMKAINASYRNRSNGLNCNQLTGFRVVGQLAFEAFIKFHRLVGFIYWNFAQSHCLFCLLKTLTMSLLVRCT